MKHPTPYLHTRLKAYTNALAFYRVARDIRTDLPTGHANIADQFARASSSICLNLAEGAAAFSPALKRRYFRIALASAGECAAILDLLHIEGVVTRERLALASQFIHATTILTIGLVR